MVIGHRHYSLALCSVRSLARRFLLPNHLRRPVDLSSPRTIQPLFRKKIPFASHNTRESHHGSIAKHGSRL